jgi:hypothetical protein
MIGPVVRAGGENMERWGLFLGFMLGAIPLAIGGAALYWLKGPALWAGAAAFGVVFWCAIMSVRAFERSSLCIRPSDFRAMQASSEKTPMTMGKLGP